MGQEEGEHADKERRHEEVGIVHDGIFRPVAFLGMGVELGKSRRRLWMARHAGREDVLLGKSGTRIGRRQNAVSAVAVPAFGYVGISEPGDFPMIRFPIRVHFLGMTIAALLYQGQLPLLFICFRD